MFRVGIFWLFLASASARLPCAELITLDEDLERLLETFEPSGNQSTIFQELSFHGASQDQMNVVQRNVGIVNTEFKSLSTLAQISVKKLTKIRSSFYGKDKELAKIADSMRPHASWFKKISNKTRKEYTEFCTYCKIYLYEPFQDFKTK
ncbi:hypothetical protein L596_023143 [Steinernema carpocapsae]|uniref:Uncharacterized protein n=1 Tax=Steinernema carpocapsae TaxID=34508 RepID=A0A4U5MCS5_STECR|nr:hypothetical protein L596_023143 [Steinernema carpocapsae]